MKFVVIALFALVAGACAQHQEATAEVLRSESIVNPDSYNYGYETSNGIAAKEQGSLKQIGTEQGIDVQGEHSWTSPDGQKFTIRYVANENGYQPQGDHLPVAPAVPEQIARALDFLASQSNRLL